MVLYRFICAREGSKGFIPRERRDMVSGDDVMVNGCVAVKANKQRPAVVNMRAVAAVVAAAEERTSSCQTVEVRPTLLPTHCLRPSQSCRLTAPLLDWTLQSGHRVSDLRVLNFKLGVVAQTERAPSASDSATKND